jgi:inorganic pyrophosphatase
MLHQHTNSIRFIGKSVKVSIDRAIGSRHPKHDDLVYGVNYGYVPGTTAPDGEELDAYVLGVTVPISDFEGICIAVVKRLEEKDDKLIVVPKAAQFRFRDIDIRASIAFQEKFFQTKIIRKNVSKRFSEKLN